ncbi:Zinc finger protein 774 [Camelus dromedarius]|uniref:Zinc finger protein 774 n=1 Tax=Camelus dromedarius TaxID=9838 RepID=A0A5N4CDP1_CAMDR|nr:Zinc finger protein 774 [Camelus dromedarius]
MMWLGTSGKSELPGHCFESPLQGYHPARLEEWALKGISRPSVISQLEQKEEPWVLPLQNFEARKILRESHTVEERHDQHLRKFDLAAVLSYIPEKKTEGIDVTVSGP